MAGSVKADAICLNRKLELAKLIIQITVIKLLTKAEYMKINQVLLAVSIGIGITYASEVISQPADPFIKKSDVFFTQPLWDEIVKENEGIYSEYNVDATMWGFTPPTYPNYNFQYSHESSMGDYVNGLLNHDLAGIDWVSRIEWDVIWEGMTTKYPNTYQQAMVKRLDGENLEIDWFPGHYFFSSHEPLFLEYVKWQIADVAFYGDAGPGLVDAILFDSQQSSPAHYYWGGDFGDNCMANFNTWLSENYTASELFTMLELNPGEDINDFHYGTYLKGKGYTSASYEAETVEVPNNIPLSDVYRHFLQDWNNEYLAELVRYTDEIAEQKGYPYQEGVGYIEVGTSSPLLDPYWNGIRMPFNDEFDFYVQEFNHRADELNVSSDVMLMYKLAEAIDKPLALTAQPYPDWRYMVNNPDSVDLVNSWIAQAYGNGATFMTPEHMWTYAPGETDRYYDPVAGDYDYIYEWIGEKSFFLDGFESVAKVGLVYSHNAYRQSQYDELDVFEAAAGLMEQNIPYKLVVAGDDWWPKSLTDADQSAAMDQYDVIVKTNFNGIPLDNEQATKLASYGSKVVTWPDVASINSLLPSEMSVSAANVALFPRENPNLASMDNAPRVMHIVNRDFNSGTKRMNAKNNFTVTIKDSLYSNVSAGFVGAAYSQAGQEPVHLDVSYSNGVTTVSVPNLNNWGILELYTKPGYPCEDTPDVCRTIEKESRIENLEVNDNPDGTGEVFLDGSGDDDTEQIHRFEQNWAWGAYSAGAQITQNTQWTGVIQFQQGAKAGSRIYTRFDETTELSLTSKANVSSYSVDMSGDDAAIVLNIASSPAQDWAILLRDDSGWWQSSAIGIEALGWSTEIVTTHQLNGLTWTALDASSAGVIDMDEVDAGGEAPIALGAPGVPDLRVVEGIGVIALEDSNSVMSIRGIGVANGFFFPHGTEPVLDSDNDGYSDDEELAVNSDPFDAASTPINFDGDACLNADDAFPRDATRGCQVVVVDTDGDTYSDADEIAVNSDPYDAASTPINFDGDACLNIDDAFPRDATRGCEDETLDTDGDTYSDEDEIAVDSDPFDPASTPINYDGDACLNVDDAFPRDATRGCAVVVVDSDGDTYSDNDEIAVDSDPNDPASTPINFDGDACLNEADAFPRDATECFDFDNDGLGDNADLDDDNDNFSDVVEGEANSNPNDANETPYTIDTDGDSYSNGAEIDVDSDHLNAASTPINFDGDACDNDSDAFPRDATRGCNVDSTLVTITETFDDSIIPGQMYNLDNRNAGNEYAGRFSSGWAWGGFTSGNTITHNTNWGGIVQFQGGAKAGSRIYTRFDTMSAMNTGGNSNVSAISANLSDPSAQLMLSISQSPAQNIAMLVRTQSGWWQSSSISLSAQGWNGNGVDKNVAISSLTWRKLNDNNAAIIDMDNVNQGGESRTPSPTGSATTIDLQTVTGFGIIALQNRNTVLSINKIGLGNVAVTAL